MHIVTMEELKNMNCNTFSKKDDSPRGVKTVYMNELKVGDKVVIENYFHIIVA